MDESLRILERKARAGGLDDWARFVSASARVNEEQSIAALREVQRGDLVRVLQMTGSAGSALEVMNTIENQIDSALSDAIWRERDAPLPPREAVLQSVLRSLTPDRVEEIRKFHEIKLVIASDETVERNTEALQAASQTMEGSRDPYVSEFAQNHLNDRATPAQIEVKKKKWRFVITEGAQTFPIPEWDDGNASFEQRRGFFRNGNPKKKVKGPGSKGMSILDFPSYIALMYQGLRHGKPIDCKYENDSRNRNAKVEAWQYTLLNEIDEESGLVGAGAWSGDLRRVYLVGSALVYQDVHARLRPAVVGDIEI